MAKGDLARGKGKEAKKLMDLEKSFSMTYWQVDEKPRFHLDGVRKLWFRIQVCPYAGLYTKTCERVLQEKQDIWEGKQ